MPDESLLTPELRAQIGVWSEPAPIIVDLPAVLRTVETYGGARHPVSEGEPVPAAVLVALEAYAPQQRLAIHLPEYGQVSHEISVERPLVAGERLAITTGLASVVERFGGRFGQRLQVRHETVLLDGTGAAVARTAWTNIRFDRRPSPDGLPAPSPAEDRPPPPAGRTHPRPPETVEAGDELPPLALQPSLVDNIRCCALTWNFSPYFYEDLYGANARTRRIPLPGPLRLLYLFRAAAEWIGAAGSVRSVRIAYRNPAVVGGGIELHGRVARVYVEQGRRLADIEQSTIDSRGVELDRGFATIEMGGGQA